MERMRPWLVGLVLTSLLLAACEAPTASGIGKKPAAADVPAPEGEASPEGTRRRASSASKNEGADPDDVLSPSKPKTLPAPTTEASPEGPVKAADGGVSAPVPAPAKAACAVDEDCALGKICTAGACVPGCHTTLDCPIDASCNAVGQCIVDPAPTATTTTTPTTTTTTGIACASDGVCNPGNNGSGQICTNGVCVAGCRQDNQCPGVKLCVAGQCT